MEVGDDAGDDPGDIENVQDRDGHQAGSQEASEVSDLPVPDNNDEEEDVEDNSKDRDDRPGDPPPCCSWDHLDTKIIFQNRGKICRYFPKYLFGNVMLP